MSVPLLLQDLNIEPLETVQEVNNFLEWEAKRVVRQMEMELSLKMDEFVHRIDARVPISRFKSRGPRLQGAIRGLK